MYSKKVFFRPNTTRCSRSPTSPVNHSTRLHSPIPTSGSIFRQPPTLLLTTVFNFQFSPSAASSKRSKSPSSFSFLITKLSSAKRQSTIKKSSAVLPRRQVTGDLAFQTEKKQKKARRHALSIALLTPVPRAAPRSCGPQPTCSLTLAASRAPRKTTFESTTRHISRFIPMRRASAS